MGSARGLKRSMSTAEGFNSMRNSGIRRMMVSTDIRNPKPEIRRWKPGSRNPKPEIRDPEPNTRNPKPENRNPKTGTRKSETKNRRPKAETRNPKPETRNQKPKTRNLQPETKEPNPSPVFGNNVFRQSIPFVRACFFVRACSDEIFRLRLGPYGGP